MNTRHSAKTRGCGAAPGRSTPEAGGHLVFRRAVLRSGLVAAVGLTLADRAPLAALQSTPRSAPRATGEAGRPAHARSVIQIWMWGGPAHLDTFDPKPEAGSDYTGPLDRPIPTNAEGIAIGQLLPQLARQADKYSIIRSMTHGVNAHETASYMVQTGRRAGGRLVYPSVGAVVSLFRGYDAGYKGLIPPYIVLTQPQGRFSEAGFLGARYKPFATGGDPAQKQFAVEGIVARGISRERQRARRDLLRELDTLKRAMQGDPRLDALSECESEAYDMILGDAGRVFDLSGEDDALRERYGRNTFGQSCLTARRLVEVGVPYITINYRGWDTHKRHFQIMNRKLPELDRGMATLLADLSDRGLLDSTIVWWGGEFGRGPKVQWSPPWDGGRSHHGRAFSAVLAGGGFKGGRVIGSSDSRGIDVDERPVYPWDLIGALYERLGIGADATLPNPRGGAIRVTPAADEGLESGGRLSEIL